MQEFRQYFIDTIDLKLATLNLPNDPNQRKERFFFKKKNYEMESL